MSWKRLGVFALALLYSLLFWGLVLWAGYVLLFVIIPRIAGFIGSGL